MEITGEEDVTGNDLTISKRGQKDIHLLIKLAYERNKWSKVAKCSLDTYELFVYGS